MFFIYHAIVKRIVRRVLADVGAGRTVGFERRFRPDATFCFSGDHVLGGERRGREQIAEWFASSRRLFPKLTLTPLDVVVSGGPWATGVATRFRVSAVLPGGEPYTNEGVQFLRLRWGAIADDRLYEDTARLGAALRRIAEAGQTEALEARA